jgi:hypothetical protein
VIRDFAKVIAALSAEPGVNKGRMFGAEGLKVGKPSPLTRNDPPLLNRSDPCWDHDSRSREAEGVVSR